jgi:hypothetical protein
LDHAPARCCWALFVKPYTRHVKVGLLLKPDSSHVTAGCYCGRHTPARLGVIVGAQAS